MDKNKFNILFWGAIVICILVVFISISFIVLKLNNKQSNKINSSNISITYKSAEVQQTSQIIEGQNSTISSTVIQVTFNFNNPGSSAINVTSSDLDLTGKSGAVYSPLDFTTLSIAPGTNMNINVNYIIISSEKTLYYGSSKKQTISL